MVTWIMLSSTDLWQAVFSGFLGGPSASEVLSFRGNLPVIFGTALRRLFSSFTAKSDGSGIFGRFDLEWHGFLLWHAPTILEALAVSQWAELSNDTTTRETLCGKLIRFS
jgi:hypothetical protein